MVKYLKKLISLFYKIYPNKQIVISKITNNIPLITRPIIKLAAKIPIEPLKQKQGKPFNSNNKQIPKN